jgi:hypothetical protein
MTRLGKMGRLTREMREGLNVRLRCASAAAETMEDKSRRQVGLHCGEVLKSSPNDGTAAVWGAQSPRLWWSAPPPTTSWHILYFLLDERKQSARRRLPHARVLPGTKNPRLRRNDAVGSATVPVALAGVPPASRMSWTIHQSVGIRTVPRFSARRRKQRSRRPRSPNATAWLRLRRGLGEVLRQLKAQFAGFNLDGLRNLAGVQPPERRVGPGTKARLRRAQTVAGAPPKREVAEAPIKVNQTKSNQIKPARVGAGWIVQQPRKDGENAEGVVVVPLLRLIAAVPLALRESSRIEVNQAESNLIKPNQTCEDRDWSGQRTVVRGERGRRVLSQSRRGKVGGDSVDPWLSPQEIEFRLDGVSPYQL